MSLCLFSTYHLQASASQHVIFSPGANIGLRQIFPKFRPSINYYSTNPHLDITGLSGVVYVISKPLILITRRLPELLSWTSNSKLRQPSSVASLRQRRRWRIRTDPEKKRLTNLRTLIPKNIICFTMTIITSTTRNTPDRRSGIQPIRITAILQINLAPGRSRGQPEVAIGVFAEMETVQRKAL